MKNFPVETWQHAQTGQTVVLIGMTHVADGGIYVRVGDMIADLQARGFEVHAEGVRKPPPNAPMTDDERAAVDALNTTKIYTWLADLLGLDMQRIPGDHDRWINTDMDVLEFLRALPERDRFLRRFREFPEVAAALEKESRETQENLKRVIQLVFGVLSNPAVQWLFLRRRSDPNRAVIIDARNARQLAAIDATADDVVATWGRGHLPGLGDGLRARGFVRVRRERLRAERSGCDSIMA